MVDFAGRMNDELLLRKYSHYQGYKWGCILAAAGLLALSILDYHIIASPMETTLCAFIFIVGALFYSEKMSHAKTILRYKAKITIHNDDRQGRLDSPRRILP